MFSETVLRLWTVSVRLQRRAELAYQAGEEWETLANAAIAAGLEAAEAMQKSDPAPAGRRYVAPARTGLGE